MTELTDYFPGLRNSPFEITSNKSRKYNCIAWAAGDDKHVWWPDRFFTGYWPPNAPRNETIDAFINAFQTLGYSICQDGDYEPNFIKIAIFVDSSGSPTHAARQEPNGMWTSKCGSLEDIQHDLYALCGQDPAYGSVACYMKKPI